MKTFLALFLSVLINNTYARLNDFDFLCKSHPNEVFSEAIIVTGSIKEELQSSIHGKNEFIGNIEVDFPYHNINFVTEVNGSYQELGYGTFQFDGFMSSFDTLISPVFRIKTEDSGVLAKLEIIYDFNVYSCYLDTQIYSI